MKNKIISLSGQPVTGKGTTVKSLKEKLIQQYNYKEENIHIISTGEEFRTYFNTIVEFVRSLGTPIKENELLNSAQMKRITKNEEYRKILINSIIQLKKSNIDLCNFSVEQANNLKELNELRGVVDTIVDNDIAELGKELSKEYRAGEIWLVDSRLAFHNIPESFAVRLTANADVAGERLFNDKNRGEEDNKYETVEEAKEAREKRRIAEQRRYKDIYGIDLEDEDNYDLIIDTSYADIDDISDVILECLDLYLKDEKFAKKWTSCKTIPLDLDAISNNKTLFPDKSLNISSKSIDKENELEH